MPDGVIGRLDSPGPLTSLCSQSLFMVALQQGIWVSYAEIQGSEGLRQE